MRSIAQTEAIDAPAFSGLGRAAARLLSAEIAAGAIIAALAFWFGVSQLLLWRFLGAFSYPVFIGAVFALLFLCVLIFRSVSRSQMRGPTLGRLLFCFAAACLILIVGGEGRFLYANIDWHGRDAVLRDLSINDWPFAYAARGELETLRLPIGMQLAPSLAYRFLSPEAGDIALLLQNSILLGAALALGSLLFDTPRKRAAAFCIFVMFSGMDIIGSLIANGRPVDHLEWWARIQYSSHVTMLFWTPHYAIAGWLLAFLFMLNMEGKAPLGAFYVFAPLTAIWSPLTLLGITPFAAIAGVHALLSRRLTRTDFAVSAIAVALSVPALLYLSAGGGSVGYRFYPIEPLRYAIFQLLEVAPFLAPLAFLKPRRFGAATFLTVAIVLLAAPFVQVGYSIDFMMRATIPAFAILAVLVVDAINNASRTKIIPTSLLAAALVIGAATPVFEIARAFAFPASPRGSCSYLKARDQFFAAYPKESHISPLDKFPAMIRPTAPALVGVEEPEKCWDGEWPRPEGV